MLAITSTLPQLRRSVRTLARSNQWMMREQQQASSSASLALSFFRNYQSFSSPSFASSSRVTFSTNNNNKTATSMTPPTTSIITRSSSSTTTTTTTTTTSVVGTGKDPILLYERSTNRKLFPRAALGLSTMNCLYWFWYTFDFIPTVNQSPLEAIHMDYSFGYFGISISFLVSVATTLYPFRLVSKLEYHPISQHVVSYQHDIPTIYASQTGTTYPLGTLTVDSGSIEAQKLVAQGLYFRGQLALKIKSERMPLIVDVHENEMKNLDLLIQLLITPETLIQLPNYNNNTNNNTTRIRNRNKENKKKGNHYNHPNRNPSDRTPRTAPMKPRPR